ncbi:hypothetical protein RvY_02688 [Ramazzottius varieornatus]|uniref:Major facilitator superfamily (MFS) profile domain-containing protein n=1 Tax=Ramazzottius varieornatus TaxID=947166 RepID=A0A1D1UNZ9_RAMVA|nr:hypothetical protein RvY_02688 [Ramazzottius varieornatus]
MSLTTSPRVLGNDETVVVIPPRPASIIAPVADIESLHDAEEVLAGYPQLHVEQQVANDVPREEAQESHSLLRGAANQPGPYQRVPLRDDDRDDEWRSQDTLGDGVSTTARSNVPVSRLPPLYASLQLAPIAFFFGLASGLAGPVIIELFKARVCEYQLIYPSEICHNITSDMFRMENTRVTAWTSHYSFFNSLVGSIPSALIAIFSGSWSDHFGRKIPMVVPFIGMLFSALLLTYFAYFPSHPAWILIVPLLSSVFGGWIISLAAIFAFMGDYSTPGSLVINLAVFDGTHALSTNIGSIVGGALYGIYGFGYPFMLYAGLLLLCILYIVFFIRDRRVLARNFRRNEWRKLFTTRNLRENKEMLLKERVGLTRRHIHLILIATTVAASCMSGVGSIQQLFFENPPLNWTLSTYTVFTSVNGIATGIIMMAAVPVLKRLLNLKDTAIGIIGVTSAILGYVVASFAFTKWLALASAVVGALAGLQYVAARSLLSNLVDEDERGKMMSVIAALQAVVPILGAFVFTSVFAGSVMWWPGFSFALAAFFMIASLCAFCYIDLDRRKITYAGEPADQVVGNKG